MTDCVQIRRELLNGAKRVVIKVGSRLLTGVADTPKETRINQLVAEISGLRDNGLEVVLVSSGAIAAGMMRLQLDKRPHDITKLQALAAIGQSRLMSLYESACLRHGFHCAQILLSLDDVKFRRRHLNTRNCIDSLLTAGVLPIINENDTVSVDEIRFGDNDRLAAMVGTMVRANLTILLTTVDGLHGRDGKKLTDRISVVTEIDDSIRQLGSGTDGNPYSVGGMATKLDAASMVVAAGESMWIADGGDFSILRRIIAGEDVGTVFVPGARQLTGAKRFLAFFAEPSGIITVDAGAVKALVERGKSLLPSGITSVEGTFDKGDTVRVVGPDGAAVAVGICNYTSHDLGKAMGLRSDEIPNVLGEGDVYAEAVHRNNMTLV